MASSGEHWSIALKAGADLSALQYRVVEVDGTMAVSNETAFGVLQNHPQSGEHATIAFEGHLKAYAGAAVTAGAMVMVASGGWLIAATSGMGRVGKAVAAASSGGLVEGIFNFTTAGSC